ncbi:LysR substrate-binding domain-containing protein [Vibrio mangrovi]|uniref:HTH-type transcriptional regulator CysL n=1 Tax=Vibrio mangrovi TaxID=474394 RepID=A0A1Y6IW43_9VIBR|nr:LysR substrate-binding domain-containing protein [Vibrio mangrovi]MDW6005551.1 LysR substrate-binding domain-containing protein [Vibrio mangrovi]SMS00722.1 HTH-type transcriptional regulator CysL [Vibrio mangrovi]
MRYTLKQIAVFDAIAEYGSVSQAADYLSLTQSATSMSLSQLEKVLGRSLFERQGKQMRLTHWGEWLRPRAKRLLQDARQIETGFSELQGISGELTICASQTPAEHLLPELVSSLDRIYPDVRVKVSVKSSHNVIEDVLSYRSDLGIIEGRCDDHRLRQEIWCNDHLTIVASADHPYAALPSVSFELLEQARWVLREPGSGTRMVFESAIHPHLHQLDVWREYDFVPVLCSLTAHSDYLTCLPYLEVKPLIESKQLVALNVPQLKMDRSLSFVWRADIGEHPLIDCVRETGLRMVEGRSQLS